MNNPGQVPGPNTGRFLLLAAAVVLALEPLRWLIGTWVNPGYSSFGMVSALAVAGISLKSGLSPLMIRSRIPERRAVWLLLASSGIRLIAQLLGINVVGGAMLALDVYALAVLFRLPCRRFAVSPLWLPVLPAGRTNSSAAPGFCPSAPVGNCCLWHVVDGVL